jgi:hypothetical protein
MDQDVVMEQVRTKRATALVGKFHGRLFPKKSMSMCIKKVWRQQSGYVPIFHLLPRGWITFIFKSAKDKETIFKGKMVLGQLDSITQG